MRAFHEPVPVTDEDLLQRVAVGDESALRVLFARHSPWLLLRLRRRSSDDDAVADALQDTFVAVWRGAAGYRGSGDVGGWLWGIAIRRLVSRVRRLPDPVPIGATALAQAAATVTSAEDQVLLGVEHGDLADALRSLSPELRQVVQATLVDGLTTREAAQLLRLPQGTVKSRVRAAKAQLRTSVVSESRN